VSGLVGVELLNARWGAVMECGIEGLGVGTTALVLALTHSLVLSSWSHSVTQSLNYPITQSLNHSITQHWGLLLTGLVIDCMLWLGRTEVKQ
jgi:hypothetical protein